MAASKHTNSSSQDSKKTVFYKIIIEKRVRKKDLPLIPLKDRRRIVKRIGTLAENPRPHDSKKLVGREEYRIRQGKYRILYMIDDNKILVLVVKVGKRENIYG